MPIYTAKTAAELPDTEQILAMSGLDFMRGVRDGTISSAPIATLLNFRVDQVEHGHVVISGAPEFRAFNPMGTVHGGWYGAVLDSCMGCAVMTVLPRGTIYTTLEYKVNITRAIPLGLDVIATGQVQHVGRSTGVANGEIRGAEDGKLYATGSTTCMIMTPPAR